MADTRKSFTFTWKIKNFSFSFNNSKSVLRSPIFNIPAIYDTKWNLVLFSNSLIYKNCVVCYIERKCYDLGPIRLVIDSELSFIEGEESVIDSRLCRKILFLKGNFDLHVALRANKEEVYISKKKLFISKDTLTIRCRMWKNVESIPVSDICSVTTRINTKRITFIGTITNFNSLNPNCEKNVSIKSQPKDFRISSMLLRVDTNGKFEIEIKPAIYDPMSVYKFKVFILKADKNKLISCQGEIYDGKPFCAPLTISKSFLIKRHEKYLPNDMLTLQCEVTFSAGNKLTQIGDMKTKNENKDIQMAKPHATNPMTFSTGNKLTRIGDTKTKFKNQDVQIAKSNPTNPIILSAGNKYTRIGDVTSKYEYQNIKMVTSIPTNPITSSAGNELTNICDSETNYNNKDVQISKSNTTDPIILSAGNKFTRIGDVTSKYEYQNIKMATSIATIPSPSPEEHHIGSFTSLQDGSISFFNEGILCDIKLRTATEIFSVNKSLLIAQSPVFKSMFMTDMTEKTNDFVDIEDLDADTVREMLFFIYTDTLNNLEYERAKSLYHAADKYNIVPLKHRCSDFLKKNLQLSNCCDVLLLSDKHQDNDLKRHVQLYIAENDLAVFNSDEWKDLKENHHLLITDTFQTLYMDLKYGRN